MAQPQTLPAGRGVPALAAHGRRRGPQSLPRPQPGAERNARPRRPRRPSCARPCALPPGPAPRLPEQPQAGRRRERGRHGQAGDQRPVGGHAQGRMRVPRAVLPHALPAQGEDPHALHGTQRTFSGRIPGHLRKAAAARGVARSAAPRHLLPAAAQIAEGTGGQVHVREEEVAMSGIASAFRGVPHALVHQQHPHRGPRQRGAAAAADRRNRTHPSALSAQEQAPLRLRGACGQTRRQGQLRLQGRPQRGTLPIQLPAHDDRVGLSGHGGAHRAFRRRLARSAAATRSLRTRATTAS